MSGKVQIPLWSSDSKVGFILNGKTGKRVKRVFRTEKDCITFRNEFIIKYGLDYVPII